ncbi:MAG: ATP-binding protein [Ruminococcus sp.]|nr:ATP-binding protein [Ruminococcus sp.]
MIFKIKNFGKIDEANIKLDGITVICGDNNTGKSTVGKALFSFFNSLYDLNNRISSIKISQIRNFLFSYAFSVTKHNGYSFLSDDNFEELLFNDKISIDELKNYIDNHIVFAKDIKVTKESLIPLVDALNVPVSDVINELVLRNFDNVMNGQIKNDNSIKQKCTIEAIFNVEANESVRTNEASNVISFTKVACKCDKLAVPIQHTAYYINSPFVLDWLNNPERINILRFMNPMDRSTVNAIIRAQADINADSMSNILESVINRADLKNVEDVLKLAYRGDTKISNGKYFYTDENGKDFDFRNISAGLKSFALIERMLETGVLKKKDILILDEPEIHLHSEWQIIYAELIVMLQKYFDLTILLVTHSFQFLESLDFFMKKHGISTKGNYYIPEITDKGFKMKACGNNPNELKQNLAIGSVKLANLEFEYDMEHDEDDT